MKRRCYARRGHCGPSGRIAPCKNIPRSLRSSPAYRKLAANRPGTFLLESAENGRSWSRWSFIGAGAPSALTVRDGEAVWLGSTPQGAPSGGDPLHALRSTLDLLATGPTRREVIDGLRTALEAALR